MFTRAPAAPGPAHTDRQLERLGEASADLDRLQTVDLRLRIDSAVLQEAIEASLVDAFDQVEAWRAERLSVGFYPGYVAIDAVGRYREADADAPHAESEAPRYSLAGDVRLHYQSGRISWYPEFHRLLPLKWGEDVPLASAGPAAAPSPAPAGLDQLEAAVRAELAAGGRAELPIDPLPLGVLETGARLRQPFETVLVESSLLGGVLTTAGAAVLVAPETTTFALDLGFVPRLPNCQASVGVGRATFAADVRNREPRNTAMLEGAAAQTRYFFTDIVDTRANTTVVHYWFADGRPVSLTELDVEPSARWRTWSERPDGLTDVRRLQVLVIEKGTGCILEHRSIVLARDNATGDAPPATPDTTARAFSTLREAFAERSADLPPAEGMNGAATVDARSAFFATALSEALYDLRLVSSTTVRTPRPLAVAATLAPFPEDVLSCETRDCDEGRVCIVDFDDCPVRRDTRDCRSCLFRNPLNNRCLREAEDPICIAARDAENQRLEALRQSCIAGKARQRDACLAARDRELANCRARASRERTDCANQAEAMAARRDAGRPIATIGGAATLAGDLRVEFSEFRIAPDLQNVRMQLSVSAVLEASGTLRFTPDPKLTALAACLRPTESAYRTPLILPPWQGGLATSLETDGAALQANWSGLVQTLEADPPLVERFLEAHPDLFERCALEIDARRSFDLLAGEGADLLRGNVMLDLRPEPTRISLLPAYLETERGTWVGEPRVSSEAVSYRLEEVVPRRVARATPATAGTPEGDVTR